MTEFRINIVIDPSAADRGVKVVERRLNQLSGQADSLRNLLGRALTGIGLAFSGRELMRLADEFTNIQNKLATVTDGVGDLANKTDELFAIANRTRTSYAATAELYSRVARSAKVLGRTEEEVTKFTETLSKSLIVSGASAQEARAGLIQLSQGIASGVLRGDELRSVLEQLPYTADIIAKQLGVTRGELRELGEQGRLTADVILDAFKNAASEVDAAFAKTTPTLEQSFTVLRNNLIKFVGETNKANGITKKLSELIIKLSNNIEVVARGVIALSVALGANYFLSVVTSAIGALGKLGIALLANPITALPALIAAGIAALVAFGDQITLTEGGLATLQDLAMVALPKIITFLQSMAGTILETAGLFADAFLPSIEQVLVSVATFVDKTIGFFSGLASYLGAFWDLFSKSPLTAVKIVVKGIVSNIDLMLKGAVAGFMAIGSFIARFFKTVWGIVKNVLMSIKELLTGNLDAAQIYGDIALREVKNLAQTVTTGFAEEFASSFDKLQKTGKWLEVFKDDKDVADAGRDLGLAFQQGFAEGSGVGLANTVQGTIGGARGALSALLKEAEARAQLRKQTQEQLAAEKKLAAERDKAEAAKTFLRDFNKLSEDQLKLLEQLTGNTKEYRKQYQDLVRVQEYSDKRQQTAGVILQSDMLKQLDRMGPQAEMTAKLFREGLEKARDNPLLDEAGFNRYSDNLTVQALESATTIEAGFQRAFANIRLEATNFASVAEDSFMVLADVGTDALTQLVTEGTVNFKDLARNAIAQLAQIISRLLMMQLLSSTLGFLGFTPAAGAASAGISGQMASGGTTQPGRSYLVGERGPEVFTPGQTGVVSPNAASMAAAPPQVNVQVVNVNDPNEVPSALNSGRADQAILNVLQRNRQALQRITS